MTTKTDEQERRDFEAHFSTSPFEWEFHRHGEDSAWPGNYQQYEHQCAWEAWLARAALQSQTTPNQTKQWLDEFDMLAMALYTATDDHLSAYEALIAHVRNLPALQSQDREDSERIDFIEANPGWLRVCRLGHPTKQQWACVSPFTNYEFDRFKTAREAIDHARRRIEGGGE